MRTPTRRRIGIIGGGQLARMMAEKAARLDLEIHVLDPTPDCPAARFAATQIVADFDDADGLRRLAERSDVLTFDIERGDIETLRQLADEGHCIRPDPQVLFVIGDKLRQRRFLSANHLPVPRFVDATDGLPQAIRQIGYPVVQKARCGGYDGRGVALLSDDRDLPDALVGPTMVEERVDIQRELAVVVVRGADGAMRCYPTIETLVDPDRALLDGLLFPAPIPRDLERRAWTLAVETVAALDGVGAFTVELFLDRAGELWINEVSPRPHNAGHVTIEAAETCQFEQHLRAITGMPLGGTGLVRPAAMVNLLGSGEGRGRTQVAGVDEVLAFRGARLHLYGKAETWSGRKMGHLTVLDERADVALERARNARQRLRIEAEDAA